MNDFQHFRKENDEKSEQYKRDILYAQFLWKLSTPCEKILEFKYLHNFVFNNKLKYLERTKFKNKSTSLNVLKGFFSFQNVTKGNESKK